MFIYQFILTYSADIRDTAFKTASEVLGFMAGRRRQDWSDERDTDARKLLDTMHATHLVWINDKNSTVKKQAYTKARQSAQVKLRAMKDTWWKRKSQELQDAVDQHDTSGSTMASKRFMDLVTLALFRFVPRTDPQ